jgi:glycosyltransferase involved in cell wall biosynthesis
MDKITFTASMIVRNEERFLEDCLESIKDVVDEIVIVDTGSTDGTKEIARRFGARVFDFKWNDDFGAARNEAIEHSRGEWILYIDADERLRPIPKDDVMRMLSDPGKVAYTVLFHPVTGYTAYREYRIFRNTPRIRFHGVIHESMMESISALVAEQGLEIGSSPITIDHLGFDGDYGWKHGRNLPMLKRQIENDPGRVYLRWHLGVVLKALGDIEGAEESWTKAVDIVRRRRSPDIIDIQPYYELIRLKYEKGEDTSELLREADKLFLGEYLISWMRGMLYMSEGRYTEAVSVFMSLISVRAEEIEPGRLAYDKRIFGEFSFEPLATCYYKLGEYEESERYYTLASECDPGNLEYQIKRKFLGVLLKKAGTGHE